MGEDGPAPPRAYGFAGCTLDLARAALLGPGGEDLGLRPKAFDVLRHLVENAGRVVGRDELLEAVWPGLHVGEEGVTQCVREIRRALGDDGQRVLRTVPRRGYMLDAEVTRDPLSSSGPPPPPPSAPEARAEAAPTPPPPAARLSRSSAARRVIRAAPFVLLGALVLWRPGRAPLPSSAMPVPPAPPQAAPPPPSPAAATAPPIPKAAEPPSSREAAEALHREGMRIVRDGAACRPRWLEARASFERAVAADPTFAPAHAEAAFTRTNMVLVEASLNRAEDLGAAEDSARRAVSLAPDLWDAHAALGAVLQLQRRHAEALAAFGRAVALDGRPGSARANMGLALLALGRAEEAGDPIRASLATAGSGPVVSHGTWLNALGLVELHLGRGDHGAEHFRRSLASNASTPVDARRLHFAAALALGGRVEDARAVVADVRAREPGLDIAYFRRRAESDHPAYLAQREHLYRGLASAGLPEVLPAAPLPRLLHPSCVPAPSAPGAAPSTAALAAAEPPTPRQEAARLLKEGAAAFGRPGCPANWLAARPLFERAIAADPAFAPAHARAAFTYTNAVLYEVSPTPAEDLRNAERHAENAVALAPDSAESHVARAAVLRLQRRHEEALEVYRRAVRLDGGQHPARANAGLELILLGRPEEAEAPIRASIAQEPQHAFRGTWQTHLGLVDLHLGRGDHGARHFREALAWPSSYSPEVRRLHLAAALALGGRVEDARAVVADVRGREPHASAAQFRQARPWTSTDPVYLARRENLFRGLALAGLPETSEAAEPAPLLACAAAPVWRPAIH